MRNRIAKVALVLGALGLVGAPAAAAALSAALGRTVILVSPHSPEVVAANKATWSKGEPVPEIYGIPGREPQRVLFAEPARLIVPEEDPSLTLYAVDKQKGENPLQVQTAWFAVKIAMAVSGILLIAGALHFGWKRFRASKAP